MQQRIHEADQRFELMQRLNQNLAFELGTALDELDALKRTIVDSNLSTKQSERQSSVVLPSFMRVMEAEQSLHENFVYDGEQALLSSKTGTALQATCRVHHYPV